MIILFLLFKSSQIKIGKLADLSQRPQLNLCFIKFSIPIKDNEKYF
jgi:hypothetical protein